MEDIFGDHLVHNPSPEQDHIKKGTTVTSEVFCSKNFLQFSKDEGCLDFQEICSSSSLCFSL